MKQSKKAEATAVVVKPDVNVEKRKAVQAAIDAVRKQYGAGSVMMLGGQPVDKVPIIPSGCLALDRALGIGGMPRGRVVEIYGPESSGKTTMALSIIAEAQKLGGTAAFVDAEHALDLNLAKNVGVDVDTLLFSQPEYGEQALEIVETFVRSGGIDVIVVDSVAALTPKAEIEGDMGDSSMGVQARLMSQAMRKLTSVVATSGTLLIFINQLRMKIGVMYGNPETTTGGQALKFYASIRLDVRIKERIKEGDVVIGNHLRLKVVKNKLAPPFREAELDLIYGKGIDQLADLIEVGMSLGIIERSGAWYSFDGERIGQGRDAAVETLKNDAALLLKLKSKVTQAMFVKEPPVLPTASSEEETKA